MNPLRGSPRRRFLIGMGVASAVAALAVGVTVTATAVDSPGTLDTSRELPVPSSAEAIPDRTPPPPPPPPGDEPPEITDERRLEEMAVFAEYRRKLAEATTEEEAYALQQELSDELQMRGLGGISFWGGPPTRGTEVLIAGKNVRLPDDTELDGVTTGVTPAIGLDGSCPICDRLDDLPWLNIVRGDSKITVGLNTGVVVGGRVAVGEEAAFDFLKDEFPEQAEAIDRLPTMEVSE